MRRSSLPPLVLLAALLAGGPGLPLAQAERSSGASALEAALASVTSPLQGAREAAIEGLTRLLKGPEAAEARRQIAAALPKATWAAQVVFAEVLARDGTPASIVALLQHLRHAPPSQFSLISLALVRDERAGDRLLDVLRTDPGLFQAAADDALAQQRVTDLRAMLRRMEIEGIFIGRKSRSGGTGYYKGQYDDLASPERKALALQIVLAIALDEALPMPGQFVAGTYQFLRPLTAEIAEFRDMAINAVAELATTDDVKVIERLETRRQKLQAEWDERYDWLSDRIHEYWRNPEIAKRWEDHLMLWEDGVAEYADVLACLQNVSGGAYTRRVREFLQRMDAFDRESSGPRPLMSRALKSSLLIRVGWYKEAIEAYQVGLRYGNSSRVLSYYNMACAYANWSLQDEERGTGEAQWHREQALINLGNSVRLGWSDLDWMRQDRDLDPLRSSPRYLDLEALVRERLNLPPAEPPPGPGDPDGR